MSQSGYRDIVGHSRAIDRLKGSIRHHRVAHAYLFSGPPGIGKRQVGRVFARTLVCGKGEEPCEKCAACLHGAPGRLIEIERLKDKQDVSIAQIRDLIRDLSFRSNETRVVIIDEADRMNEEAMNALLKTLEEPPEKTVILLVAAVPSMLLPTIRSRCQTVLFQPLDEKDLASLLKTRGVSEPEFAAALADGSVGRAPALAPDLAEWRTQAADFLAKALAGELNPIVEAITRIRDTEEQRDRARMTMNVAILALREALRAVAGAPIRSLVAPDSLLKKAGDLDDLAEKLESLLDHLRMIDLNANVGLAVEDALLRL